jgi:hypothetical protein
VLGADEALVAVEVVFEPHTTVAEAPLKSEGFTPG